MTDQQYEKISTAAGKWLYAARPDFAFAFLKNEWDEDSTESMIATFETVVRLLASIKEVVKRTSGDHCVVDELYLLDSATMTAAMNSIPGMGQTSVTRNTQSSDKPPKTIDQHHFLAILQKLGGNPDPVMPLIRDKLASIQARLERVREDADASKQGTSNVNDIRPPEIEAPVFKEAFGIVAGTASLMEQLNIPTITFEYVCTSISHTSRSDGVDFTSVGKPAYEYTHSFTRFNFDRSTL